MKNVKFQNYANIGAFLTNCSFQDVRKSQRLKCNNVYNVKHYYLFFVITIVKKAIVVELIK